MARNPFEAPRTGPLLEPDDIVRRARDLQPGQYLDGLFYVANSKAEPIVVEITRSQGEGTESKLVALFTIDSENRLLTHMNQTDGVGDSEIRDTYLYPELKKALKDLGAVGFVKILPKHSASTERPTQTPIEPRPLQDSGTAEPIPETVQNAINALAKRDRRAEITKNTHTALREALRSEDKIDRRALTAMQEFDDRLEEFLTEIREKRDGQDVNLRKAIKFFYLKQPELGSTSIDIHQELQPTLIVRVTQKNAPVNRDLALPIQEPQISILKLLIQRFESVLKNPDPSNETLSILRDSQPRSEERDPLPITQVRVSFAMHEDWAGEKRPYEIVLYESKVSQE